MAGCSASGSAMALLLNDHRDQQVATIAVAAMVPRGAHELHRDARLDRLHHRLVEPVQVVGQHADCRLLVDAHRGRLLFGPFLDATYRCHWSSPMSEALLGVSSVFPWSLFRGRFELRVLG